MQMLHCKLVDVRNSSQRKNEEKYVTSEKYN